MDQILLNGNNVALLVPGSEYASIGDAAGECRWQGPGGIDASVLKQWRSAVELTAPPVAVDDWFYFVAGKSVTGVNELNT